MSTTSAPSAEKPKRTRKAAAITRLSRADALDILRSALAECQHAGVLVALGLHPAGSLLLLNGVDVVEGRFVCRDETPVASAGAE